MWRNWRFWLIATCLFFASSPHLSFQHFSHSLSAQEDEEQELAEHQAALETRLDELEQLIERAEKQGDEEHVRELRSQGEELLDELEAIERAREGDEETEDDEVSEQEARELEMHRIHLEIERLQTELEAIQQEAAMRMVQISESYEGSVSLALTRLVGDLGEDRAMDFLSEVAKETDNGVVRRMALHELARLRIRTHQPDKAEEALRRIIFGG